MKRYLLLALTTAMLVAAFSSSALAKERLFTFSNNNNGAVKEVNYLDNGAKVVFMDTAAKATDSTVIITVVLEIPDGTAPYQK